MQCCLDIKTGHILPWTSLQTAAYILLDTPVDFIEKGHQYFCSGIQIPSVTSILMAEGFIDTRWFTEEGRERGTLVHIATHLDNIGILDESTIDSIIAPYLAAWRKFKQESGFIIEQSEAPMACKAYRYAGTPDVIGHFPTGVLKRAAVELHNDGKYILVPFKDRRDTNVWLSVLSVYNWKQNHLKRNGEKNGRTESS